MQIIRDTREKLGHSFAMLCDVVDAGLPCGDYTTSLLQGICAVERKASTGEIYLNLVTKKNKERFYRELDKLKLLKFACIVFEFPESFLYSFPVNSGIPSHRWKYMAGSAKFLRRLVHEVEEYGVPIVYCDNKEAAELYIYNYLKQIEDSYEGNVPTC